MNRDLILVQPIRDTEDSTCKQDMGTWVNLKFLALFHLTVKIRHYNRWSLATTNVVRQCGKLALSDVCGNASLDSKMVPEVGYGT